MASSTLNVILVLSVLGFVGIYCEELLFKNRERRENNNDTVSPEPEPSNTTINSTDSDKRDNIMSDNTGLIIGIVVAVIIVIAVIAILVLVVLRLKKQRSSDMEREAKVQMNTTKNAGVYVDLATNPEEEKEVKETDRLRNTEEA